MTSMSIYPNCLWKQVVDVAHHHYVVGFDYYIAG